MIQKKNQNDAYLSNDYWRNFDEIIRVIDSIQLTSKKKVATPANWKKDEEVIIVPAVSDEEAKELLVNLKN